LLELVLTTKIRARNEDGERRGIKKCGRGVLVF
jgi:hypothetical protein